MKQFLTAKIKENPILAMVVCCAAPFVAVWVFSSLNVLGSWGYYGLMLLCPILHIMMCRMGHSSYQESQKDYSGHAPQSASMNKMTEM